MRGDDQQQAGMCYIAPEERVPADHPLRPIRARQEAAPCAPDLVERQFTAAGPDRLWVTDSTAPT